MAINKGIVGIGESSTPIVPNENFKALIYTGDGTTGRVITTGLAADLVIIKNRSTALQDWIWFDIIRGPSEYIRSNRGDSPQYNAGSGQGVSAFGSTTVTIGDNAAGNIGANGSVGGTYSGAAKHVMYAFKAGGAAVSNTDGTITSQVSANVDAGFSIVKYVGNSSANGTVGTGLSSAAEIIIVKNIDSGSAIWSVYNSSVGANQTAHLNTTAAYSSSGDWNSTTATASVFSIGSSASERTNSSGQNHIAYAFHSVDGYSKMGSYSGTNGVGTNTIVTGFEPAFVMIKRTDSTGNWRVYDNARDSGAVPKEISANLALNSIGAEYQDTSPGNGYFFFSSTGFYFPSGYGNADINGTGDYIFMAFAE